MDLSLERNGSVLIVAPIGWLCDLFVDSNLLADNSSEVQNWNLPPKRPPADSKKLPVQLAANRMA